VRRTDAPVLVQFPSGEREAVLFLVEEETVPNRFSIHRLVEYVAGTARMLDTTRIVPVVVFLKSGSFDQTLTIGTELRTYLQFNFEFTQLARIAAKDHLDSANIYARLNLPNMKVEKGRRVDACLAAIEGLRRLVPDAGLQQKYGRYVSQYAGLTGAEMVELKEKAEDRDMKGFVEVWMEEGEQRGLEKGLQQGLRVVLELVRSGTLDRDQGIRQIEKMVNAGDLPRELAAATIEQLQRLH